MRKMILEVEFLTSMIYEIWKIFGRITFHPEMILRHLFQKNTGLLIFNSLKQKKLIFDFFVNRNWKKLTGSGKRARILADNRKSYHPIETLISRNEQLPRRFHGPVSFQNGFCANLEYRLSPPNQSAKSTDLKKIIIFDFSANDATFSFFLLSLYFECVHSVVDIPVLCKKNGPKMRLKIKRSLKTLKKKTLLPHFSFLPERARHPRKKESLKQSFVACRCHFFSEG